MRIGVAGGSLCALMLAMAGTAIAADAKDSKAKSTKTAPEASYQIVSKPLRHVTITIEQPIEPTTAAVMYPIPPDTQSQRIVNAEMVIETTQGVVKAVRGNDVGPLRKPLLGIALRRPTEGKAIVTLDIDLLASDLKPGQSEQKVGPLAPGERSAYLASEWHYEFNTPGFKNWMKENDLVRKADEKDVDFALRVLQFIQKNFNYKIHDGNYMSAKKAELATDDLGFFCFEKSAECWGLSRIYTCVLRANGIPCRQVSGFMLRDGAERQGGHHVRGEVYLNGTGWVLAELAGATNNKKASPLKFLGRGSDDMAIISRGINYKLPGPRGPGSVGTMSGFGMVTADGKWSFPHGTWTVSERQAANESDPAKKK